MEILVAVSLLLIAPLVMLGIFFVRDALKSRDRISGLDTGSRHYKRNPRTLWVLFLLAIVYVGLLSSLHRLTGINMLDGGIGSALGLYICAHPAPNAVNMLFFQRGALHGSSGWPLVRWLALNLLVLLAGGMVIFVATRQLVAEAP